MSEKEMAMALNEALYENEELEINNVRTFEEVGMLTRDAGLIIKLLDGSEFQVTIVRRG